MESLLEFARGPLFVATFLIMVLGLLRVVAMEILEIGRSNALTEVRGFPWSKNIREFISWVVPTKNFVRERPVMSALSFVFHLGILLVPLFFASHIFLWERGLGIAVPAWIEMGVRVADALTLMTIATGLGLLAIRVFHAPTRFLSSFMDYFILGAVLVPFISGFLATHPSLHFTGYTAIMLVHVLSAELVFVLLPFSKLSHAVLFPFDRVSSDFYWRLSTEGARKVAHAMRGPEAKV